MPWAHLRALTTAAEEIMGPSKSIGSCCCECHGPIRGHQQHLPKKLWAQVNEAAAANVNVMGPSEGIDSPCRRNNGPKRMKWQLPLQVPWAHRRALTRPAEEIMGQVNEAAAATASAMGPS